MPSTVNLQGRHSIYHLPAFALLISMQRWHCKIHSPESSHRGSSASNEMHRWCMTRCVTEHPLPKWLQEASSAAFFHAPLQLLWIQFKCKATKKMSRLCLLCVYCTCSWAVRGFSPSAGPTDHTDRSIGSDWLLDPLGADLMRMDHPFFVLLQYPSNILQPIFTPTVVFCCWTAAQTNVFAFFILYHVVFGPIKWSEGIIKFYYWGPLGRIYCPDNGLDVLQ